MGILDLPIELFRPIVEDALGFCACCWDQPFEVWDNLEMLSLARVNTVFESEVFRIWERRRFLLSGKTRPSLELLQHQHTAIVIARYISRLSNRFPEWNSHFPALLHHVVDMIINLEQPSGDRKQTRDRYISKLCRSADFQCLAFRDLENDPLTERSFRNHLLVCAVYLEKVKIVEELTHLGFENLNVESEFWSSPLHAAILVDNLELTRKLVLVGAELKDDDSRWTYIAHAVRSTQAIDMVPLVLRHDECIGSYQSVCLFERVLMEAIQLDKENVAEVLLESHRTLFGHGSLAYILRNTVLEARQKTMKNLVPKLEIAGGYTIGRRSVKNELRSLALMRDASEGQPAL